MAGKSSKCIYVLHGQEPALIDYHREQIISRSLGDADRQTSLVRFEADAELADVLDGLRTLPFLAPCRVVVMRRADSFVSRHRGALEKYVKNPSPNSVFILQVNRWNKSWNLHKLMGDRGEVIDCSTPAAKDLHRLIRDAAGRRGKKIEKAAVQALLDSVGADQTAILNYVEQLSLYAGDRGAITASDVGDLVAPTAGPAAFALTNAITAGDPAKALRELDKMLVARGDEFRALGSLHWHLKRAYSAKQQMDAGAQPSVKMPAGARQVFMKMLHRLSLAKIQRDLRRLVATDLAMKSGADPKSAMRELVITMCS